MQNSRDAHHSVRFHTEGLISFDFLKPFFSPSWLDLTFPAQEYPRPFKEALIFPCIFSFDPGNSTKLYVL